MSQRQPSSPATTESTPAPPSAARPFCLPMPVSNRTLQALVQPLVRGIEAISGLGALADVYAAIPNGLPGDRFPDAALEEFDIRPALRSHELLSIPSEGPCVLVANHPFGMVEGLLLMSVAFQRRRDVRVLANSMLARIPELAPLVIGVDPFGSRTAIQRNRSPLRQALGWLKEGGLLATFPAGEVASLNLRSGRVQEKQWHTSIGRLVQISGARVVPIYFSGRNSLLFQLLGLVHPRLRTALLPHEIRNKRGRTLTIRIGSALSPERLRRFDSPEELTAYLRDRTRLLRYRTRANEAAGPPVVPTPASAPLPSSDAAADLLGEVTRLGTQRRLAENGEYETYLAEAGEIPMILREIGRLREVTFRAVGEGTGKELDLDAFDQTYLHLFVWHRSRHEVIGAYRLGLADLLALKHGIRGLYTRTLFAFSERLIEEMGPAIELGRSFIRPEYQREFAPLHLLWRGIGTFVARHPRYKMLFGPVSISNAYQSTSRQLLVEFLQRHNFYDEFASLVKPLQPLKVRRNERLPGPMTRSLARSLDEVSDVVAELEGSNRTIPILLKHYLKLGGRLLGFNVDPDFNQALDGLILVDLTDTNPRILERYLGRDEARQFLAHHRSVTDSASPAA